MDEQALIDSIKASLFFDPAEIVVIENGETTITLPKNSKSVELFCDRAGFDDPALTGYASLSISAVGSDSSALLGSCQFPGDSRIFGIFPLLKVDNLQISEESILIAKIVMPGIDSVPVVIRAR